MSQFHSDEYVEFLQRITPENMNQFTKEQMKCASLPAVMLPPGRLRPALEAASDADAGRRVRPR